MTQEIKDILDKPADQVTEDEKKTLEDSRISFAKEVSEVCLKHGWQHVPFLDITAAGIVPKMLVVPFSPEESKDNA